MKSLTLFLVCAIMPNAPADEPKAFLVARYEMNPVPGNAHQVADSGPFHHPATLGGDVAFAQGPQNGGSALHFSGTVNSSARVVIAPEINRTINTTFTITAWVKADSLPPPSTNFHQFAGILTTHQGFHSYSVELGIDGNGRFVFMGDMGWDESPSQHIGRVKVGQWQHLAVTYQAGADRVLYVDGVAVSTGHVGFPINVGTEGIWLGSGALGLQGSLGRISLYEGALTADQIKADMGGTLAFIPATTADIPAPLQRVNLHLTRFDQPLGLKTDYAPTRQQVQRVSGPNAVDWPIITVDGRPVFTKDAKETITIPLRAGTVVGNEDDQAFGSVFKVDSDTAVMPGHHWMRAMSWLWNRKDIYTVDPEARGSNDVTSPDYELFTFPIVIKGKIQSVKLTSEGQTIYERRESLESLMLALPGAKYELSVNDAPPQAFETGLMPIVVGQPRDEMKNVDFSFADGTTVSMPSPAESFTNQRDWDADSALMKAAISTPNPLPANVRPTPVSFTDVPVSPLRIHGIDMSHGMSGGWYKAGEQGPGFTGDLDSFASHVADLGYDEIIRELPGGWENREGYLSEQWLNALAAHGVKGGMYPLTLSDSNLPIFYYDLADYHGPAYRDMQLVVQRFASYHNFFGTYFGGDNGSYTRFWDWSPPKTRWAEAFSNLMSWTPTAPLGPEIKPGAPPYNQNGTEAAFLDFVHKYDQTWDTYEQLSRAATDIMPNAVVTIGSFGSAPGVFGHGGWLATVPGKLIFDGMPVQMAYDWNEQNTSKPMQLAALLDRLNSDHPTTPTWAQVDEFRLFFSREARQRAYALALTRGVASIGGNFLPSGQSLNDGQNTNTPAQDQAKVSDYRELHQWIHTYGGVYAGTKPDAKIAILFVEDQSISRSINSRPDKGPQEGKVTEALFICEAAGWPAKVVTPDELKRGLDPGVSALLLVGLNKIDDTWIWSTGLEEALQQFVARGGKILSDDDSVSPLPSVATGMRIWDFLNQTESPPAESPSILLFERNKQNISLLQKAMAGIAPPVAVSDNPTIWAVPHTTGDVQYVTVVNWGYRSGTNADKEVVSQKGTLAWTTGRPIYDVRAGRLVSASEAAQVDLTKDGFCLYALPPQPMAKPKLTVEGVMATVDIRGIKGVPVQIDVRTNTAISTVYAASGTPTRLPLVEMGDNKIQATELLSGQTSDVVETKAPASQLTTNPATNNSASLSRFWTRKDIPIVVALTSAQAIDPEMNAMATRVADLLKERGRTARVGRADPTDVVRSIQVAQSINVYPKWQTASADLVLFGSVTDNVLIFDQARGCLLPSNTPAGNIVLTYSPFVGGYEALNILGANRTALTTAVNALVQETTP